jgi:hypothetical protein
LRRDRDRENTKAKNTEDAGGLMEVSSIVGLRMHSEDKVSRQQPQH